MIGKIRMITKIENMDIEDLWQEYSLGKNPNIRDELISRNIDYAKNTAIKKSKKMDTSICPLDDLISASYVGLVQAFDKFDPYYCYKVKSDRTINEQFLGWSSLRINGEIVEAFRKACYHNPRAAPAKTHKLVPVMFSTIEAYSMHNDNDETFQPPDKEPDLCIEDELDIKNLYEDIINDRIEEFTEVDKMAFLDYFYSGKRLNHIGKKLGLKEGASLGRQKTSIRRLKRHLEKRRINNETYSYANKNWMD